MSTDIRVSATLTGSHSLEADGVRKACRDIERTLMEGTTEYTIQSLVPDDKFIQHGGRDGSGLVAVKINQSNFMVVWDDESTFEVPAPVLDVVNRCLVPSGDAHIRVNAIVADVAMAPLRICDGLLAAKFTATAFDLTQPETSMGNVGEIEFRGLAVQAENATVNLAIFGERKSNVSAVPGILENALVALSGHCRTCVR